MTIFQPDLWLSLSGLSSSSMFHATKVMQLADSVIATRNSLLDIDHLAMNLRTMCHGLSEWYSSNVYLLKVSQSSFRKVIVPGQVPTLVLIGAFSPLSAYIFHMTDILLLRLFSTLWHKVQLSCRGVTFSPCWMQVSSPLLPSWQARITLLWFRRWPIWPPCL